MKKSSFFSIITLFAFTLVGCNSEHSHHYDFDHPTWTWESVEPEGYIAKVTVECTSCKETTKGHYLTLDATVNKTVLEPTCEADGALTYTATATYGKKVLTDSKVETLSKLGHDIETITVKGNYPKSYVALDRFDASNLVVEGTCAREGCGKTITLSTDEYFVVYQTQGVDHLCAGDTKVTISANYYPFAKYELTGLTVTKIPNAINGMADSYDTTCHQKPDLSGVTSLSGDIELKYYSDSGCTQEIDLENLEAGTYYIKAIAGDVNHETVTKVATLNVNHVFDQCVQDEKYIHTAATVFENASYFKSCICGDASTSEKDVFVVSGSKLPYQVSASAFTSYVVANEEIPAGYNTVSKNTVTYNTSKQGSAFLGNLDSADSLDKLNLMILTKNNSLCQNTWSYESVLEVDKWYAVEITKNEDSTYSSTIKDENGKIKIRYEDKDYSQVLPYYQWGDESTTEIYSTEVYGVRYKDETFNTLVSDSAVPSYTISDVVSPKGYKTVTLNSKTFNDADQGKEFLSDISISDYQTVSFAFKTKNRRFCKSDWSSPLAVDTWHTVTYERNSDGTYDCIVATLTGTTKFSYPSVTSFKSGLKYYNWDGSAPNLEWYSTEVRGVLLNN